MEQTTASSPPDQSAKAPAIAFVTARPASDDPVDRLNWVLDEVGQYAITMGDVRAQIGALLTWPGRVSGWRRCGNVYAPSARGLVYIFGFEQADPWPAPGAAQLDPRVVVGTAECGVPIAVRNLRIPGRSVAIAVGINSGAGIGSIAEIAGAPTRPPVSGVLEIFPPRHEAPESVLHAGHRFDRVRADGIYVVNDDSGIETAVLLVDSMGAPRAWVPATSLTAPIREVAISPDNRYVLTADSPSPVPVRRPFLTRAIRSALIG